MPARFVEGVARGLLNRGLAKLDRELNLARERHAIPANG
jgi:hypothetical protein